MAEDEVDHYAVLGLPSGEAGLGLSLKEIEKAYRNQSRARHPDKRPDDPNATADFQRLTSSFELLKDEAKRSSFDAKIRSRIEKIKRDGLIGAKRRKMASDLEERERAAAREEVDEEEMRRILEKNKAAELKRELEEFRVLRAKKMTQTFASASSSSSASGQRKNEDNGGVSMDKERILKVSWERAMGEYTAAKLREIFEMYGGVEDVVIRSKGSKKKGSALVVMSSNEAAIAATQSMSGSLSNPLLVLPLQSAGASRSSTSPTRYSETVDPNILGAGFRDYEASVLKKLKEAGERRKAAQQQPT